MPDHPAAYPKTENPDGDDIEDFPIDNLIVVYCYEEKQEAEQRSSWDDHQSHWDLKNLSRSPMQTFQGSQKLLAERSGQVKILVLRDYVNNCLASVVAADDSVDVPVKLINFLADKGFTLVEYDYREVISTSGDLSFLMNECANKWRNS